MSFLSNLVKKVAPIVATVAPGTPIGTAAQFVAVGQAQQEARYQQNLQRDRLERERKQAMQYFDQRGGGFVNTALTPQATQGSGFGSSFGSFISDVGRNIVNPISGLISSFGSVQRPQSAIRQPAQTTITNIGARETQSSGTQEAFVGGLGGLTNIASRFLRSPVGNIATGVGVGSAVSMLRYGS